INNMVVGVSEGYQKKLEVIGTGYKANVQGQKLVLNLGYSHPIEYAIPQGITITVEDNTKISIAGIDKQVVGQVASNIRKFRLPEPYKGKGVKYADEVIKRKAGKAAK
ncbi:MAG: 50S ribosomal protein L6, partial [Spirochaetes bacterium]|nr:50S ribosomal protein L6 [Spirochaetota bacterium]